MKVAAVSAQCGIIIEMLLMTCALNVCRAKVIIDGPIKVNEEHLISLN